MFTDLKVTLGPSQRFQTLKHDSLVVFHRGLSDSLDDFIGNSLQVVNFIKIKNKNK